MSNIQLAANLQRLRKDHHFTQTQFSKKLNISRQAYSNYENVMDSPKPALDRNRCLLTVFLFQFPLN